VAVSVVDGPGAGQKVDVGVSIDVLDDRPRPLFTTRGIIGNLRGREVTARSSSTIFGIFPGSGHASHLLLKRGGRQKPPPCFPGIEAYASGLRVLVDLVHELLADQLFHLGPHGLADLGGDAFSWAGVRMTICQP
jgi:hypothetical protein